MSTAAIRGSCLCGALTFEVTPPLKFCAHCHCSMCRRAHGAPMVTWVGVTDERFRITAGEEHRTEFSSSPEARRGFCARCGSSLFFQSSRWPGEIHIAAANLENLAGMSPMAHVFYSDRADWFEPGDELPRCGGATGVEPLGK